MRQLEGNVDQQREEKKPMVTTGISPESVSMNVLSVVLLGENEYRRRNIAAALSGSQARITNEGALPSLDSLSTFVDNDCDVLIVDLEQNEERALTLVEAARGLAGALTVMVYSRSADSELLVRCMRAGAREFLSDPLSPDTLAEALVRASVRRDELKPQQKELGGLCLVFVGAKGGSGTTTVCSNFAVQLAKESGATVALLDLNLRLGDAALTLGLTPEFSTEDALRSESRLDRDLVSKLLLRHNSGLHVLAGPVEPSSFSPSASGVSKLISLLRRDFAYLVVDAGSHYSPYGGPLLDTADRVYLVTQANVVELRNSHYLIRSELGGGSGRKLEVVLNRYTARSGEIDEESIVRALGLSPQWRIPSDFHAVQRAQNAGIAVAEKDSAVTRVLKQMARAASGKAAEDGKKKKFGLF